MEPQGTRLAVSLGEAGRMIGVCKRTVANYVSAGELPARKLGRRTVILIKDLEKFLSADRPSVS